MDGEQGADAPAGNFLRYFCKRSRSGECHGGRYQAEQCCADRTGDVVIEGGFVGKKPECFGCG